MRGASRGAVVIVGRCRRVLRRTLLKMPVGRPTRASSSSLEGSCRASCRSLRSAGQEWTTPTRLPEPINSPFTEFAPGFGGGYLYFTSERPGVSGPVPDRERPPGDVYRVRTEGVAAVCAGRTAGAVR